MVLRRHERRRKPKNVLRLPQSIFLAYALEIARQNRVRCLRGNRLSVQLGRQFSLKIQALTKPERRP